MNESENIINDENIVKAEMKWQYQAETAAWLMKVLVTKPIIM